MNKDILTEDAKTKIEALINETVDVRVSTKEKLLTEEVNALKAKIQTEAEANEKVLVEQAEQYKKKLEETIVEETTKFRDSFTKAKEAEVEEQKTNLKALVLEEAKAFKTNQDAVLVEEVKKFRSALTEKVSDYIEAKISEMIPSEIMESATKLAVLEPLVTGIMESFSKNYIKLDTTSFKLIKESRDEIATLNAQLQEKSNLEVKIKKEKQEVERALKVATLTEGLTQVQKEQAVKLLEGVEYENLNKRYTQIRDVIIESKVVAQPAPAVVQPIVKLVESKKTEVAPVVVAKVQSQADKEVLAHQLKKVLTESEVKAEVTGKPAPIVAKVPTGANPNMKAWAGKVKPGYIETQK
jgi:hypothetical protein